MLRKNLSIVLLFVLVCTCITTAGADSSRTVKITPTPTITEAPTPEPTKEPTPEPTKEPTPEPTEEPTPRPTEEPTPRPTEEPTPEPTEEPTPEPTEEPTPEPTEELTPTPTQPPTPAPTPIIVITFGKFEQDNNIGNGKEDIEWLVLDQQDGKVLLLSKYALEAKPYHQSDDAVDINWEECSLRQWLNNDFLNSAFSQQEKELIRKTEVKNVLQKNKWQTDEYITQDYVFLLCRDDLDIYFEYYEDRVCLATEYLKKHGGYFNSDTGYSRWWLRTPGRLQSEAMCVDHEGELRNMNELNSSNAARPAIWVDNSVVK